MSIVLAEELKVQLKLHTEMIKIVQTRIQFIKGNRPQLSVDVINQQAKVYKICKQTIARLEKITDPDGEKGKFIWLQRNINHLLKP